MRVNVVCDNCGQGFQRATGEVNRSQRKGRNQYCSKLCTMNGLGTERSGQFVDIVNPKERKKQQNKALYQEKREQLLSYRANWRKKNKQKNSNKRRDHKIQLVLIKGGRCQRCGFDGHPAALEFHHRNPELKRFPITTVTSLSSKKYSVKEILEEMEKCDLLCSNCHRIDECDWEISSDWKDQNRY